MVRLLYKTSLPMLLNQANATLCAPPGAAGRPCVNDLVFFARTCRGQNRPFIGGDASGETLEDNLLLFWLRQTQTGIGMPFPTFRAERGRHHCAMLPRHFSHRGQFRWSRRRASASMGIGNACAAANHGNGPILLPPARAARIGPCSFSYTVRRGRFSRRVLEGRPWGRPHCTDIGNRAHATGPACRHFVLVGTCAVALDTAACILCYRADSGCLLLHATACSGPARQKCLKMVYTGALSCCVSLPDKPRPSFR